MLNAASLSFRTLPISLFLRFSRDQHSVKSVESIISVKSVMGCPAVPTRLAESAKYPPSAFSDDHDASEVGRIRDRLPSMFTLLALSPDARGGNRVDGGRTSRILSAPRIPRPPLVARRADSGPPENCDAMLNAPSLRCDAMRPEFGKNQ